MGLLIVIVKIVAIISSVALIAQASDYYCRPKGQVNQFHLGKTLEFIEDQIIPQTDGVSVPKEGLNCRWKISNDYLDDPVVVLSSIDPKLNSRGTVQKLPAEAEAMRYELHLAPSNFNTNSTWHYLQKDTLRAIPMPKGSYLAISFLMTQKHTLGVSSLRIRLMEPGFCCPEMVNFKGSCYTYSSALRTLAEELAATNETNKMMSLASFRSYSALQKFVRESQRTRVGSGLTTRSKEPLNLARSHRIGIFYDHRRKNILYLKSTVDTCEMAEFEGPDKLFYTLPNTTSSVSCGSIRVAKTLDSGDFLPLVDFTECNLTLPALISFPDVARKQCENCTESVLSWIRSAERSSLKPKQYFENGDAGKRHVITISPAHISIFVCLITGGLLLLVVLLVVKIILLRKLRKSNLAEAHPMLFVRA